MSAAGGVASGAKRLGCYKCGKDGHMARDCTAPPSEWIKRQDHGATQAGAAADGGAPGDAATMVTDSPEDQIQLKQKRQKPKVTLDLLKKTTGLPEVYHNFPEIFQKQCKGRGHEVSDLRKLLEMYKRWQDRIFPSGEFDSFISDVEKLSGSNIVKNELQDMRMNLIKVAQDIIDPPKTYNDEDMQLGDTNPYPPDNMATDVQPIDGDVTSELDEEELLELAAQAVDAAPATDGEIMDDEELLAMLDDGNLMESAPAPMEEQGQHAQQPKGIVDDEIDEEELLELAAQAVEADEINEEELLELFNEEAAQ